MKAQPKFEDFPGKTFDKLRYGDTDRQGHVNNAVYATFFETGRCDLLNSQAESLWSDPKLSWVLVRIEIDFRAETFWPGEVQIGTGVESAGNSSITMAQAVFQEGRCVASGRAVVVQMNTETHRPEPLSATVRAALARLNVA